MPTKRTMPSVAEIREALTPTEAEVKRAVQDWLTLYGYHWTRIQSGQVFGRYKNTAGKVKGWNVQCAEPGTADLLVVLPPNGYACWIEIKSNRSGSKQSPEQVAFAAKMAELGAGYRLVRDVSEMSKFMAEERANARVRRPEPGAAGVCG